jgi:hypothetical protein
LWQRQVGALRSNVAVCRPGAVYLRQRGTEYPSRSWFREFDMSFFKNFRFQEKFTLQFRGEFFNIFNHPNFGNPNSTYIPNADPNTTNFGSITSLAQGSNMRQTQFGLKFLF